MKPARFEWTTDAINKAAKMWDEQFSSEEIAAVFPGCNKNMILGLAFRNRDKFQLRITGEPNRKPRNVNLVEMARMWNETEYTASHIGKLFDMSATNVRSLVAKHKDKFVSRRGGVKRRDEEKVEAPETPSIEYTYGTYAAPVLDAYEISRLPGISMADNNGCKWPLTDTGPHMFCGCEKLELKPYCSYHVRKALGFGTISERRAIKDARKIA